MDFLSQAQIQNYQLISQIGDGSTATVMLAKRKQTKTLCVLKMIQKSENLSIEDQKRLIQEKQVLIGLNHPFFVKIKQAFQTRKHIAFALQYCSGGDLYTHLHMSQRFNEDKILFYSAQLILALEYLHSKNIIHRDLKPENILISKDGYLKIIDFGLSESNLINDQEKTFSICGTTEYIAPQMLKNEGHGKAYDWWMLGCCIYEMVYKISPFYCDDRKQMNAKILSQEPTFQGQLSNQLKDLIKGLLDKNPQTRLEFAKRIRLTSFFAQINFEKILKKEQIAPFVPQNLKGKKLLKVNKAETSTYTNFQNSKHSSKNYISNFDWNISDMQKEETLSTISQEPKRPRRLSTDDSTEQEDSFTGSTLKMTGQKVTDEEINN